LDQRVEPFTLGLAELDDVPLYGRLFRGHGASPELPERSIQRSTAESTTWGTSVEQDEQIQMARLIGIDEFTAGIAPRFLALERTESEPKIMPLVLETWDIACQPLINSDVARMH
jgi:hypothetical protein